MELPPDLAFDFPKAGVLASDPAFWRLYASSFPSSEREPPDVILATVQGGIGFVVRARSAGVTIGFVCAHMLRRPPALFLVYLAVAPEWRSQRIGAALFERTWATATARYAEAGLVSLGFAWEVEIPGPVSDENERNQCRRRIAFFERLGGRILHQRYLQPPVDGVAPVPMHLMFCPARGASLPNASAISKIIQAIYFEKYGATNGISSEVLEGLLRDIR